MGNGASSVWRLESVARPRADPEHPLSPRASYEPALRTLVVSTMPAYRVPMLHRSAHVVPSGARRRCVRLRAAGVVRVAAAIAAAWLTLATAATASAAEVVVVTVQDATGAAIAGAEGRVRTAAQTMLVAAVSASDGTLRLSGVPAGRHVLEVHAAGFGVTRVPLDVGVSGEQAVTVVLQLAGLNEDVTVTAEAGRVETVERSPQAVNVISADLIAKRTRTVVAQAVTEEAGVQLQQTSPTIAGVFVRGLTGNKVNVFVDGVRYSTGAQRGGISTFLDLIEPTGLERMEILRGPNSAQYGSDALGGSVQFLSRTPTLSPNGRPRMSGMLGLAAGSADRLGGANLAGSYSRARFAATINVAARHAGEMRPGGGIDSHAAVTRFFGVASDRLMAERLPDTGFRQYRRDGPRTLVSRRRLAGRPVLHAQPAGRRPAVRSTARRRREPAGRPARPHPRSLLCACRTDPRRAVRSCVAHLFRQLAARGTREPGRKRQPARDDHLRTRADHGARGQRHRVEGAVSPPDASARRRRVRRGCGCPIDRAEPGDGRPQHTPRARARRRELQPWRRLRSDVL